MREEKKGAARRKKGREIVASGVFSRDELSKRLDKRYPADQGAARQEPPPAALLRRGNSLHAAAPEADDIDDPD
jgi:hypothetical protein